MVLPEDEPIMGYGGMRVMVNLNVVSILSSGQQYHTIATLDLQSVFTLRDQPGQFMQPP